MVKPFASQDNFARFCGLSNLCKFFQGTHDRPDLDSVGLLQSIRLSAGITGMSAFSLCQVSICLMRHVNNHWYFNME